MEKVDIFDQEIGRAAIECNGNLVVVFNGKKAFWFKEQIESFVKEHPEAPLPLSVFSVNTPKAETISLQKIESPYCILQKSTVVFRFSASFLIFLILAITISLY